MEACRLLLIRHGATDNNLARPPRLQGCGIDAPLSPAGRREAARTGDFLRSLPVTAVYSSPLQRARQTAELIAGRELRPDELVAELIEADVGHWEGRSWEEIERNDPESYRRFRQDPGLHPYAGGENLAQVQQRVTPALSRLADAHPGQCIAVVAHNVVNRAFLAGVLHLPLAHAPLLSQDNCGINVLERKTHGFRLRTWNSVFHLTLGN